MPTSENEHEDQKVVVDPMKTTIRKEWSNSQMTHLMFAFTQNQLPTRNEIRQLANDLGATERQVRVWFQNKRQRLKHAAHIPHKNKKINIYKSFVPFETPSVFCFSMFLLSLFRERGFLTYRFKGIEIVNTHMPHGMIQADCWNIIKQYCENKIIILGGDFNPLPFSHVDLFMPLREIGLMNLESKHVTWNLNEALTRKSYLTPQNMQLDYIAHSKGTSTTQVLTTKDSDHYALSCEFVPDNDLMFEFED